MPHDHDHGDPKGATHALLVRSFQLEGGAATLHVENPGPAHVDAAVWLFIIAFYLAAGEVEIRLRIRVPSLAVNECVDIVVSLRELEESGVNLGHSASAPPTIRALSTSPGGQSSGPGNTNPQPLVTIVGPVWGPPPPGP